MRYSSIALLLAALLALAGPSPAGAQAAPAQDPAGPVVVLQPGPDALLLWDASALVASLSRSNASRPAAFDAIEAAAMQIASRYGPTLTGATNVTVRVVYSNTTFVTPAFPDTVYSGTVRLLSLTAPVGDAVSHGATYAEQLRGGSVPGSVKIVVEGALPAPMPEASPSP